MKYLVPISLATLFAIGADAALYAYAFRERPRERWICGFVSGALRETRETEGRFESHAIGASALLINGAAVACFCATAIRRWHDRERLGDD